MKPELVDRIDNLLEWMDNYPLSLNFWAELKEALEDAREVAWQLEGIHRE